MKLLLTILLSFVTFPHAFAQSAAAPDPARSAAIGLEQQGQLPEAEAAWQTLADAQPKNPEPLAHLGLLEARQEHFDAAIDFYRKALALPPETPGLRMNLALACFKAQRFADAMHEFHLELQHHPGDQRITILLGMSHFGMGDYLVAIPYLKQAAARDPANLQLRLTLAQSCLWSKQYPCVLEVYKEMLALNVESAEVDMLAGEALDETGNGPAAIEQFRAAVRADPHQPTAHFGLGYLLWKDSHFAEAAPEFQAELVNDPTYAPAHAYLGDSLCELNDYAGAKPELEQAAVAQPDSIMIHRDLGTVYAATGNNASAEAELQRAVALDPNDATAHYRLARLFQSEGKKDQAAAEFAATSRMKRQENEALADKLTGAPKPAPTH